MKAQNKVIVVTGAGNGVGRELVLNLLNRGARVAAVDISQAALEETLALTGDKKDRVSTHVVNIADKAAVDALPDQVVAQHGAVDGLINNAGIIHPFAPLKDLDSEVIERVMRVNFFGPLYMTRAFLPRLTARPEGHIVNVSSMGGFLPVPGQTIYGASKAAVKLMTEGLNSELADTNVHVTVVFPGAMGTNIAANSGVGMKMDMDNPPKKGPIKILSAKDAAQMIVDGMEQDSYRVLVGSDANFMDFLYRVNPKYAAGFIHKKMKSILATK